LPCEARDDHASGSLRLEAAVLNDRGVDALID
jgi:hypothetical protein